MLFTKSIAVAFIFDLLINSSKPALKYRYNMNDINKFWDNFMRIICFSIILLIKMNMMFQFSTNDDIQLMILLNVFFFKDGELILYDLSLKKLLQRSCSTTSRFCLFQFFTSCVRFGYTEGVEGQSIAKLIVPRLLRKLGNSIYQRWNDGQTVAVRVQTSKGSLILHVKSKGFRFCLFSNMMMHNNWWLLSDRRNISKTFYLKHEKIVFQILTLYFFLWLLFSTNDDDDYWCWNLNFLNYYKLILTQSSQSWIISFFD